jgi:uncharacterized protein
MAGGKKAIQPIMASVEREDTMFKSTFSKNPFTSLRVSRTIVRTFAAITCLGIALPNAQAAQSCSFNCNTADKPDEVLICQRADLCQLDIRLSALYFKLRNNLGGSLRSRLISDQTQWLRDRLGCGRDYDCINSAYRVRIRQLNQDY